jgi:hypothetical protein
MNFGSMEEWFASIFIYLFQIIYSEVIHDFLIDLIIPAALWPEVDSASKWVPANFLGIKGGRRLSLEKLTTNT